jgi:hypothetical protein
VVGGGKDREEMRKSEKESILKWANTLTDEQLEDEYYKSVYDSLGSEIDDMYELGYDMKDIREREKHEKYLCEKSSVLEMLCEQRGIKLWERKGD